ncbi:MAG: leucine dehydrogenase, partial [Thermoanaerobaculia bacterium]
ETIARLRAPIVAGAANNQLRELADGGRLRARNILYAPDYVINSGGLISALLEMGTWTRERTLAKTSEIFDRLLQIFAIARTERVPTNVVADRLAEETLAEARRARR